MQKSGTTCRCVSQKRSANLSVNTSVNAVIVLLRIDLTVYSSAEKLLHEARDLIAVCLEKIVCVETNHIGSVKSGSTKIATFLRRKSVDNKDVSNVCPSEMARNDYARGVLSTTAPVYTRIEEHLLLCETCREADTTFRTSRGKEKSNKGIIGRLFRR